MELVLIRGLPGSGKSTMARAMTTHAHYEADMFFEGGNGAYNYDRAKIKDAHEWCQRETFKALANGKRVVVSNTFTRRFEMEPYFEMAKTFGIEPRIIEATGNWPNVHGVPAEIVEKMRQRWEKSSNAEVNGGRLDRDVMRLVNRRTMMADLYNVMEREMLHSEHAAQCFIEAKRREKAKIRIGELERKLAVAREALKTIRWTPQIGELWKIAEEALAQIGGEE